MGKKSKTKIDTINTKIQMVMKTGKYVLGCSQTLNTLRQGRSKLIIIANNCKPIQKAELEYYAMLSKTPVHHYSGNNLDLGTETCGLGVCEVTTDRCVAGSSQTCVPNSGAATAESCDGIDNNCNGSTDEGLPVDAYESNDTCGSNFFLGLLGEGLSETRTDMTLYTSGDEDWYRELTTEDFTTCTTGVDALRVADGGLRVHVAVHVPGEDEPGRRGELQPAPPPLLRRRGDRLLALEDDGVGVAELLGRRVGGARRAHRERLPHLEGED